jgi:adenylate cyclase
MSHLPHEQDGAGRSPRTSASEEAAPSATAEIHSLVDALAGAAATTAPQALIERLLADPKISGVDGEARDVTVLFADIRGYSAIAERLDGDVVALSNAISSILDPLSDVVERHGGTLDKYMGDCLMAFWGAPAADADHARRACDAANEMLQVIGSWEVRAAVRAAVGEDLGPIDICIGVNTGRCFVGRHGSRRRADYSVLGDAVNVASRLQQLCRAYPTPLLVGERTVRELGPASDFIELDRVVLRGRSAPVAIFAPLGAVQTAKAA